MKSPPAEWALGIGYLAAIDIIRAHGEADSDTLSECIRDVVARHPHGQRFLAVALLAGAVTFFRHIVNPLNIEETP